MRSALTGGGIFWSVRLLAVLSARQPQVICGKLNDATRALGTSVSSSKLLVLEWARILSSHFLVPERLKTKIAQRVSCLSEPNSCLIQKLPGTKIKTRLFFLLQFISMTSTRHIASYSFV